MTDPRSTLPAPASARDADAQCRGIDMSEARAGHGRGRARYAVPPRAPADGSIDRAIDRPIDPPIDGPADRAVDRPVIREAVRQLAAVAGGRDARGRTASSPLAESSAELPALLSHLRATVTRYVGERRDAGAPVQRVLPEVKALVREAAVAEGWVEPTDGLMAQVVGWAIAGYYARPEQRDVQQA